LNRSPFTEEKFFVTELGSDLHVLSKDCFMVLDEVPRTALMPDVVETALTEGETGQGKPDWPP